MAFIPIGSDSELSFEIPSNRDRGWGSELREKFFLKLVIHDHTGADGLGKQLGPNSFGDNAINGTKFRLQNNEWLRGRNAANNADVNIIRVNTSNVIEFAGDVAPGDNTVSTVKLQDNAVTNAKIADNAVNTSEIADNAVTNAKLADNAVNTAEIANNAVTDVKLASNAVTTAKIADINVTTAKLADLAVTGAKIDLLTIADTNLNSSLQDWTFNTSTFNGPVNGSYNITEVTYGRHQTYIFSVNSANNGAFIRMTPGKRNVFVNVSGSSVTFNAGLIGGGTGSITIANNQIRELISDSLGVTAFPAQGVTRIT